MPRPGEPYLGDVCGEPYPMRLPPMHYRKPCPGWIERGVQLVIAYVAAAVFGGLILIWLLLIFSALGHANDKYAQSPLKQWFNGLTNRQKVPCCDTIDGKRIDDADWDVKGDQYRVRIDGQWIDVPDDAVIRATNKAGYAVVWPFQNGAETKIRCFLPGSYS